MRCDLVDPQRAGGVRRQREDAVRRQPADEAGRPGDGRADDAEHVEQHGLALDADQRHAQQHREEDHGRDDAVGQGMEGIGRNVEVDEVERRGVLEQRGAEERRALGRREHQRDQAREDQRDDPESRRSWLRPAGRAAWPRARSRLPRLRMIETVTYGRTVICSSRTKPWRDDAERRDVLAEEQAGGDAGERADEDFLREGHVWGCWRRAGQSNNSRSGRICSPGHGREP